MEAALERTEAETCTGASRTGKSAKTNTNGNFKAEIVWINVIGIVLMHAFALYGLTRILEMKLLTLAWAAVSMKIAAMSVTVGAHRLWTHRGFKARPLLRTILMLLNCAAMQNSIYVWARDHRVHHKYTDTDADPHNIKRGFFFAHVGWLMMKKHPEVTSKGSKIDLSDLKNDAVVMFQYKYYYFLAFWIGVVFPTWVPWYFWGEGIILAGFANLIKYVAQLNITWLINSGAHTWGYRPYDASIAPTNSLLVNLLGGTGEGYHNYHHCFPFDYRFQETTASPINFWARWVELFAALGLAYDLRTASKEMVRARMERTGMGHANAVSDSKEVEHDY